MIQKNLCDAGKYRYINQNNGNKKQKGSLYKIYSKTEY